MLLIELGPLPKPVLKSMQVVWLKQRQSMKSPRSCSKAMSGKMQNSEHLMLPLSLIRQGPDAVIRCNH